MSDSSLTGMQAIGQFLLVALQIGLLILLAHSLATYNKRHKQTKRIYCQLYGIEDSQKYPNGKKMPYCNHKEAEEFTNSTPASDINSKADTLADKQVEIELSKLNEEYWKHAVNYLVIANTIVFLSLSTLYKGGFSEVIVSGKHLANWMSAGHVGSPRQSGQ